MTTVNNPSLGYSLCPNCKAGRASYHQQTSGSPFGYTRFCDNGECSKKTCQKKDENTQRFMYENLEPLEGVEVKEPPYLYKQRAKKPSEPSKPVASEWSPVDDEVVIEGDLNPDESEAKPSGNKGLAGVFIIAAIGLAVTAMRAAS